MVTVLVFLILLLSFVVSIPRTGVGAPDSWTFMVYMNGDSDLEPWAIADFLELSAAGSSSDVKIVVQFDRIIGHDWSYGAWNTAKRFLVTQGMTPTALNATADIGEVDMGSPATLTAFIDWAVKTYPSNHFVLDIWDHGSSWLGVSYDYTTMTHLDMGGLDTALSGAVALNPGLVLDAVVFDACSMGTLEVAYQISPYAHYLIASETYVSNPGLEYTGPLAALVANPNMTVTDFADEILTHYSEYYLSLAGTPMWGYLNESFSMSVVDLQLVPQLAGAVDALASELINGMDYWVNHITIARNATESYNATASYDAVDLHHLAENLALIIPNETIDALASQVIADVDACVVNETHGTNPAHSMVPVNHTNGVALYFPYWAAAFNPAYESSGLALVNITAWDEFLALYDTEWRLGYPTVMMWSPTGTDVPQMTSLEVWFSEAVDLDSYLASLVVTPTPGGLPSYISYNGTHISFSPGTFAPGTTYTVTITTGVTDLDGQHMQRNFTWQFTMAPEEIPEFPGAVLPVLILLAVVLVAATRRGPGKAIRK